MKDFVERLRAKPEHERKRITLFTSAGITAVVALLWFSVNISTGTFTLSTTLPKVPLASGTQGNFSNLLGGAAAALSGTEDTNSLKIEDGAASSTLDRNAPDTRTVIPF